MTALILHQSPGMSSESVGRYLTDLSNAQTRLTFQEIGAIFQDDAFNVLTSVWDVSGCETGIKYIYANMGRLHNVVTNSNVNYHREKMQ